MTEAIQTSRLSKEMEFRFEMRYGSEIKIETELGEGQITCKGKLKNKTSISGVAKEGNGWVRTPPHCAWRLVQNH